MIVFASRNYRFFGYDFKPSMLAQTPNYIIIFHHKIMRIEAVYFIKKRFGDVQRLIATAKNEERIARQSRLALKNSAIRIKTIAIATGFKTLI